MPFSRHLFHPLPFPQPSPHPHAPNFVSYPSHPLQSHQPPLQQPSRMYSYPPDRQGMPLQPLSVYPQQMMPQGMPPPGFMGPPQGPPPPQHPHGPMMHPHGPPAPFHGPYLPPYGPHFTGPPPYAPQRGPPPPEVHYSKGIPFSSHHTHNGQEALSNVEGIVALSLGGPDDKCVKPAKDLSVTARDGPLDGDLSNSGAICPRPSDGAPVPQSEPLVSPVNPSPKDVIQVGH